MPVIGLHHLETTPQAVQAGPPGRPCCLRQRPRQIREMRAFIHIYRTAGDRWNMWGYVGLFWSPYVRQIICRGSFQGLALARDSTKPSMLSSTAPSGSQAKTENGPGYSACDRLADLLTIAALLLLIIAWLASQRIKSCKLLQVESKSRAPGAGTKRIPEITGAGRRKISCTSAPANSQLSLTRELRLADVLSILVLDDGW